MKTIHFNTGRSYTANGQRITATRHDDDVITFYDHSRGIDGEIILGQHCSFNQTEVMHWYDSGMYQSTMRSFTDGMSIGGVNTKYEEPGV